MDGPERISPSVLIFKFYFFLYFILADIQHGSLAYFSCAKKLEQRNHFVPTFTLLDTNIKKLKANQKLELTTPQDTI